nr:ribonuclease E/G [Lachnospiraceae bacterium]
LMDKMQQKFEQKKDAGTLTETSVRLWEDDTIPLKLRYKIGSAMEQALQKKVWLKSGAFLVIEPTEALTVIDVNSGKAQSRRFVPENFHLKINLEAAEEIARQLRLRNLSGMILVDFINMDQEESRQALVHEMRRLLLKDPNGANLVDITALGLVEITRKKTMPPLSEVAKKIRQTPKAAAEDDSIRKED